MYALSLGVQHINESLPEPVYALLSGLNASTVGIIALAAVQLADKAIRDRLTRILVILGACAGLCYNALWFFPLLMALGGLSTIIWDGWMSQSVRKVKLAWQRRHRAQEDAAETGTTGDIELEERDSNQTQTQTPGRSNTSVRPRRAPFQQAPTQSIHKISGRSSNSSQLPSQSPENVQNSSAYVIPVRIGILISVLFFGEHQ